MRKVALAIAAAAAVATGVMALPSGAATSTTTTVAVKDNFFGPKKLTVKKGSTVKWVWKGKHRHNVSEANGSFRASTRKTGTFKHTFKKKGKYLIFCTIHAPDMQMTITVK
jgi:plastocyanin